MSWTHYWTRPTELPEGPFAAAVTDWRRLQGRVGVALAGFDGTGEPLVRPDRIVFNGATPQCCEPFEVARIEFDRRGGLLVASSCKTAGLPYDVCVQAVLIILKQNLGNLIRALSDGADSDWKPGRQLVQTTLGYGRDFRLDRQD